MAVSLCSMTPLPFLVMLLLTILRMLHFVLVTDEETILLAKTAQDVFCFSRTFEDLTCFWDEPTHVKGTYRFFYTYEGDKSQECALISMKNTDGSWRHICTFPENNYGIQLFIELNVEVLDSVSNHTIFSQYLRVNTVGLIAPPTNVTVEWPGIAQQLLVNWMPPSISYTDFLIYEVLYGVEDSIQSPFRIEVKNSYMCQLKNLLPGQQYHIQVRSKPDGLSLDGIWGPWSPAVTAETPHLPEAIGLHCFTPDLYQLHCQWNKKLLRSGPFHSLLYWMESNSSSTRGQIWHKCKKEDPASCTCTFQPSNTQYLSILVTISQSEQEVSYFEEPFKLYHVVHTAPPRILEASIDRNILRLEWASPLEELAEHMVYQIRYTVQDTLKWKILQVQYSNTSEIHLATQDRYCLQLRTQPDGQRFRGDWSTWSELVCVEVPPGADSVIMIVAIVLLLCAGLVLGLGFTCLSNYSSVKQKLWPRIPDLHHVLDGFFKDNDKQQQQQVNALFCNKMLEDVPLTCLLEVLSEKPLETPSFDPLLDTSSAEQTEWGSQPSYHQHYMVLSSNNPQSSHHENEYFDDTNDNGNAFPQSLEHDLHVTSEPMTQITPFTLLNIPSEIKEERRQEISDDQTTSVTDISNQTYLLMG
ncbi:thrombopoietin receptor [Pantherophis guttatus]|uniref:Thrombopoietin receptor n=1 Tax=Pantherophis guttatus TaxID=94885 RepID=A0A6P9BSN9_PANGU|nr:thrombopoietin receptor [Pantherophis guttatus]